MTREDFNALADDLVARGYRKYPSIREADYAYYKSFGKSECEEGRSNYQICFDVYDFGKYADREPFFEKEPWSVAPMILVSREVSERIDLHLSTASVIERWIESIEHIGESFFKWVEQNIEIENE